MNTGITIDVGCVSCETSCGSGNCYLRQSLAHASLVLFQSTFFLNTIL